MYHLIPARSVATFPREELGWYKVHSWCRFYCFLVGLAHDGDFRGFLVGLAHDGDFFSEKMDTAKTIRIAKLHFESPNPKWEVLHVLKSCAHKTKHREGPAERVKPAPFPSPLGLLHCLQNTISRLKSVPLY